MYEGSIATMPGRTLFGVPFEPYVVLDRELRLGFVLLQLYGYALLLLSGGIITRFLVRYRDRIYYGQAVVMLVAIFVPVAANALLFARLIPAEFNLTELSFTISTVAFAGGIFRYRVFDLVPVARDAAIDEMRDGYVVCNDRDIVLDANPAAKAILSPGTQSLTGTSIVELLPAIEPLLRAPTQQSTDKLTVETDGGTRHLSLSVSPLGKTTGDAGHLITFRDVTARHRTERELEEERERYSTLVEQSHDGVAIIQDGVFVFVNQQMESLLGRDAAELLGASYETFVSPEHRDTVTDRYERRLQGEAVVDRYDTDIVRPDGERRVVDLQASDIQYEGSPAVMVTLRDVTDRKAYERRLEDENQKLELLNRLVRHDIRNDMSVVIGYAQQLDAELGDGADEATDETVRRSLDALLSHSDHVVELTMIVRDLMETLQDGGDGTHPVPIADVLEAELDQLRSAAADADIRSPDPMPTVSVLADDMLGSVLRNLLKNAVVHSDREAPHIEVSVAEGEDTVVVRVADDGPGVPDASKEDIFGKGEMGLESPGTGIGLYLVQTLVSSYGGEVWVEDNDPRGAVFAVELQRAA
jgi:PAS domain S-box-containing protein